MRVVSRNTHKLTKLHFVDMSYTDLESMLLSNPLRIVSIVLLIAGVISTVLCLRKKRTVSKPIKEEITVSSNQMTIETISGERTTPKRTYAFQIRGVGRVVGTIESVDGTTVRVGVYRQFPLSQDRVITEYSTDLVKGAIDFSPIQVGDYFLFVRGADMKSEGTD